MSFSLARLRRYLFRRLCAVVLGMACVALLSGPAFARTEPASPEIAHLCDRAAHLAAKRHGVPLDVLRAISLTETGRRADGTVRPWPWTVNMEGKGVWFDTPVEAKSFVDRNFSRGARSFDVGCFQINYRWHGQAFASIDDMFDPVLNADYAARFLRDLHAELGDWSRAAGAFHSRTPDLARRYRARFDRFRARLAGAPVPETVATPVAAALPEPEPLRSRVNTFPLLRASGPPIGIGSLVPLGGLDAAQPLVPSG